MPSAQGWGYATEAMQAAIDWASDAFPGRRMTCLINVDNLASMRVAGRLGFKEFARHRLRGRQGRAVRAAEATISVLHPHGALVHLTRK